MSTGTCPNATAGTGTQTCNGDGDGKIEDATGTSRTGERFTFWQHLANAGLIEGTYNGIAGAGSNAHHIPGTNAPASKIGNGGFHVSYLPNFAGNGVLYELDYGNTMRFGATEADREFNNPILSPTEAWNLDKKIDDGRPAYGRLIASYWDDACTNATGADDYDSDYKLSDDSVQCALNFIKLY